MTLTILINIEFLLFLHKFFQTKTAFGNEKVPKISVEVGCQVGLVGRHIEEPVIFCVSRCPYFPNRKRSSSLRM